MKRLKLPIEEFTTPNPITAQEDTPLEKISQLMQQNDIRHIPITKDGVVTGIVSDRDLRLASGLSGRERLILQAADIMSRDPMTVFAETALDDVAFEMSKAKVDSVIVNDGSDGFMGIFTETDALNALVEISRSAQEEG